MSPMRSARRWVALLLPLLALSACGEEGPTEVGGALLPGGAIRTFEVLLDPSAWLVSDTAFSGYTRTFGSGFFVLADEFGGSLEANTLARFDVFRTIVLPDSAGVSRTDSMAVPFAGRIGLVIDTLASSARPLNFAAWSLTEEWDPRTATWALRVDSGGVRQSWSQPGGTRGTHVGSIAWTETDTVFIPVDSQTIALWMDTTTRAKGALVTLETPNSRAIAGDVFLRVDYHPSIRSDTVITTTIRPNERTFVFDPSLGTTSSTPRVGGVPAWRTIIRFRDGLDSLRIPCPDAPNCTLRLREVAMNYAALVLQPTPPPAGFIPEDSVRLGARILLVSDAVPLERSPLGDVAGVMVSAVPASVFASGATPPIELPVTTFLRRLASDTIAVANRPPPWVALVPVVEGSHFGVSTFAQNPRLRLVLTVATEVQIR
jgi:hypothetical protein